MTLTAGSTPGGEPRLLDALLVLGPALPANDVVRIEPAGGQAAMMAILCSAFSLDPSAPDTMTRTFAQAARLLSGQHGLRVQRLLYPRQHMQLPNVLRALLDHQRG